MIYQRKIGGEKNERFKRDVKSWEFSGREIKAWVKRGGVRAESKYRGKDNVDLSFYFLTSHFYSSDHDPTFLPIMKKEWCICIQPQKLNLVHRADKKSFLLYLVEILWYLWVKHRIWEQNLDWTVIFSHTFLLSFNVCFLILESIVYIQCE